MDAAPVIRRFSADLIDSVDIPWLGGTGIGCTVSRPIALAVPAVLHGRNMIAGTISTLPTCTVDKDNNEVRNPLLEQIDPDVPNAVTMAQTIEDLMFDSISYWRVLDRDAAGYPIYARHVDYRFVSDQMPPNSPLNYLPSNFVPGSGIWVNGLFVPNKDIIRFDSPNPPLLVSAARQIRRAIKLEQTAEMFADNPAMRQYFQAKDGADPLDTDVTDMLDSFAAARQLRAYGYVPSGYDLKDGTVMTPLDLQLMQLIEKNTLALAAAMGLDPEDFGVNTTTRTYQNAVDRRQDRINECYGPYATAVAQRLSMGDLVRRGQKVRFDWDEFLKANPLDRMTIQTGYLAAKVFTRDEVRSEEGAPPMTPEQELTLAPDVPAQPTPVPPGAPANQLALANQGQLAARFSEDPATGFVFDMDMSETFSVNEAKRTITGLVLPWNTIGRSQGQRWKFSQGSLKFNHAHANRIKLLEDHDQTQVIGRLDRTWSDERGQWATFKVARGEAGDRALEMAADGVKDGLSVGLAQESDSVTFAFTADPVDKTINNVTAAPWTETSLVALPAFAGARVSAVAFAAQPQGVNMHCDKCGHEHAPNVACVTAPTPPTFTADQMAAMFAMFQNGQGAQAPQVAAPAPAEEAPAVVSPQRETAQVNEPPLYRFDGGRAQYTFSGDLKKMQDGDIEATARLRRYMDNDMAAQFANIAPADVAAFNPVPTRPELYVPNLSFPRPLGSLVTTGGLDNLIAFIVPKFSTASGLVADHTTGTEPTDGAFTATTQTITPKGLSGRVDIDREIIDSGGSPQADQIIYAEMVRAYNEKLEKRIVVMLETATLSPTGTGITGTDGTLQANLITFLAGLQFIRGGDRFGSLAMASSLYTPVVTAKDTAGRLLFPMVNPQNSAGATAADLSAVRIGSKVGIPAWALEAANGGSGKSYLFDKNYVYQWNSAPRRFTFDQVNVSAVGIAIWGYSAEAVTLNSSIYRIVYS